MDERQQEAAAGLDAAEGRIEWARPEVDRLIAGGAEATDGADTDGVTLS